MQTYTRTASKGWGSLSRVEMPSGATVDYSYRLDAGLGHLPNKNDDIAGDNLTLKQLHHDGITDQWSYDLDNDDSITTVRNPDGTTVTENRYAHDAAYAFAVGKAGLAYRTVSPFLRVDRHWADVIFSGASLLSPSGDVNFNPVVDFEYTTLLDAAGNELKMSAKAFQYDYNNNLTQTTEYDWFDPALVTRDREGVPTGVPTGATVLRVVNSSYYNAAASSTSPNIYARRSLSTLTPLIVNALQQTTSGAAITQLSYDGQPYGTAPAAGNLTSKAVWDDFGNRWLTTSSTYGLYGNLSTATDARGKVRQFFYDDATHALPTRVVVDPQNGTGTQTTTTEFDYSTGLVKSQTDANNQTTTISYINSLLSEVDPFGRPSVVTGPGIEGARQTTRTTYFDSARQVEVTSDLNTQGDQLLKSKTTANMLGQVTLTQKFEGGSNYIAVETQYDSMGRAFKISNPYRNSETPVWTTSAFDAAGRLTSVTTPDSAQVITSYDANTVTVTDQAGKQRKSVTDAGGRLLQVYEDPAGLNYLTSYAYDNFGNLRRVTQGSQQRFFMYDSLSRLIRSRNPEQAVNSSLDLNDPTTGNSQWSFKYQYDENGNLAQKTDARGVTSTYVYDALNRNTSIDYSDTTPDVFRQYDQAVNGKGRLNQSSQAGSTNAATYIDEYDAAGRPLVQRQRFQTSGVWSSSYQTSRIYNVSGNITSQTYPSGRTVSYEYDDGGRPKNFTGNLGDGTNRTYATGITYSQFGGLRQEQFGTNTLTYHKLHYNIRGQLYDVRASAVNDEWGGELGALVNYYSTAWAHGGSGTDNNGNVLMSQTIIGSFYMEDR